MLLADTPVTNPSANAGSRRHLHCGGFIRVDQVNVQTSSGSQAHSLPFQWLWLAGLCLWLGCQPVAYRYGNFHPRGTLAPAVVVVRGEPHRQLDAAREIVRSPRRLIPGRWRPEERTTEEAESRLFDYLDHNTLTELHVEIGHYDPLEQWQRLHANHRIGAGWRYTVGLVSLLPYSLFPGRVFGTTQYNPFTNTLSLNSPSVPKALYEAAWAKQVRSQSLPGTYVVGSILPGVGLLYKAETGGEVLGYLRDREEWELERQAYPHVCGELGAEGMGLLGYLTPVLPGPTASFAGRAVGGLAGRLIADTRPRRDSPAADSLTDSDPNRSRGRVPEDESLWTGRALINPDPVSSDDEPEPAVVLVRAVQEEPSALGPLRDGQPVSWAGGSSRREVTSQKAAGQTTSPHD